MNKDILKFTAIFIIVVLAQVLICNHIVLFGVAVPIVFVYFIIRLPIGMNTNILLTLSFLLGLLIDIFSDTPGVNALACTLIAMAKKNILFAYIPRDDRTKNIIPTLSSLGTAIYTKYLFSMVALFSMLVFSIEYFNFANVMDIAVMSASSCLFSFLLLLGIDSLVFTKP